MNGKIIAIVAPTRTGKTFLTEQLAKHYGVPALYEIKGGEIPERVQESIKTGIRPLDGWLYFRNRSIKNHIEAQKLALSNKRVFLDAAWISNFPYVSFYSVDPFEQGLLRSICEIDAQTLAWPDVLIILTSDDATSEKLWRSSGKEFERDETYYRGRLLPLKREFEKYLASIEMRCPVIRVDRTNLDFNKEEDLAVVAKKIDEVLLSD
jgi:deoxyadenosine/deoxycytidine kinase